MADNSIDDLKVLREIMSQVLNEARVVRETLSGDPMAVDSQNLATRVRSLAEAIHRVRTVLEEEQALAEREGRELDLAEQDLERLIGEFEGLSEKREAGSLELEALQRDIESLQGGGLENGRERLKRLQSEVARLENSVNAARIPLRPLEEDLWELESLRERDRSLRSEISRQREEIAAKEAKIEGELETLNHEEVRLAKSKHHRDQLLADCLELALRLKLRHREPPEWFEILELLHEGKYREG